MRPFRAFALLSLLAGASALAAADDDPATLVSQLRSTKDEDDLARVADRIGDVGDADGDSPSATKRYLVEHATPLLVSIAENTKYKWSLRGSAIHALRDLRPSREVLQRVADMALADSDSYVQSRGEILANYLKSLPESEANAIEPVDAAKEAEAIAFLQSRDLGVSLDQLRLSAVEGKADEVAALLAAGVDPNAGDAADAPLVRAIVGCTQEVELAATVKTLQTLLAAGADANRLDDNKNTPLMSAAQYCGAEVVQALLDGGAGISFRNGSDITPLGMAMIMNRWDAAETLVAKGARLDANEAQMVSGSATDERAKAILKKATAKKK